jgi:hypothetical protein
MSDPSNFLFNLASAIATAEGFFVSGSVPARNNNPGDLRGAPWLTKPVISGGFWIAGNRAAGIAGLYHQIALSIARGESLRTLVSIWAPPSDGNNTENYIAETARRVGITNVDEPLQNYLDVTRIP